MLLKANTKPLLNEFGGIMIHKFAYLLCWLGIHKYKIIDITYGFSPSGKTKKIKCKI